MISITGFGERWVEYTIAGKFFALCTERRHHTREEWMATIAAHHPGLRC